MNVLFCFDNKYEQHFGVALTSLLYHHPQTSINLYIITKNPSDKLIANLEKLQQTNKLNVHIKDINEVKLNDLKTSLHISEASYYRLILGEVLPLEVERILYLDSDLVVKSNLEKLYNLNLNENYIAAYGNPSRSHSQRLDLQSGLYFNAGVLLINLQDWRTDNLGNKALDFVRNNSNKIRHHDQDALNKVIDGKFIRLEQQWNFLVDLGRLAKQNNFKKSADNLEIENAKIIHFVGKSKPWYFWVASDYKKNYWFYFNKSPWKLSLFPKIIQQCNYFSQIVLKKIKSYT